MRQWWKSFYFSRPGPPALECCTPLKKTNLFYHAVLGIREMLVRIRTDPALDPDPTPDPTPFISNFKDAHYLES
jgi:hypothetical protein